MKDLLKIALSLIFSMATAMAAYAGEGDIAAPGQAAESTGEKVSVRKKRLVSAFLFLNLIPAKKHVPASGGPLSMSVGTYRYSGKKMRAVKDIYKKYGFNDAVRLRLNTLSDRKYGFHRQLALSGRYVDEMTDIFSAKGLPPELVYLPLIESGFDPYAYSRQQAAGPWQIMPLTARNLGLKIDWWVDERRDPVKSTRAAAGYLRYLYRKFGSWTLALAAYNAGEGRITSAMRQSGEENFWGIRDTSYIMNETKDYVPSYIAATAIAMYPENFGFSNIAYEKPLEHDEVVVVRPMDFSVIAALADVKVSDVRELNPELKRWCTPPDTLAYRLRLPAGTGDRFLQNMARTRGDELDYAQFYTVQKGDTVEKIAKKLGASMHDIIQQNALGSNALIITGKKLLVPIEKKWEKLKKTFVH